MEHADHLKRLAAGLRTVPPENFDLRQWGFGKLKVRTDKFDCGFTGCAIGWMGRFVPGNRLMSASKDGPEYRGKIGFDAVALYFDIPLEVAGRLFDPTYYPRGGLTTPDEVADRIEAFLVEMGEI